MRSERGFTLLEVLVAAAIMAIAVTGLLSGLATTTRTAARLTDYDRAALLARMQMDELLTSPPLPLHQPLTGSFDPRLSGGLPAGWQAKAVPFEFPPGDPRPGTPFLERIELTLWWERAGQRKHFRLETFRRRVLTQADIDAGALLIR
jgi:type II secretion system protein I